MDNPNVIFRTSRLPGNRRKTQTSKLLVPANRSAITQCFLFFSRKKFVLKLFENVENLQYQINGVDSAVHGLLKSTDMVSSNLNPNANPNTTLTQIVDYDFHQVQNSFTPMVT
eukprot:1394695-Amorphochlora_amoeboformis.AAC.1